MKLKINKASDLNSISVLPPHVRRSNGALYQPGLKMSQLRSQASQQSNSQGLSSQQGAFSQISQNSVDEVLTNDQRFCSQERENPGKNPMGLALAGHSRDESQIMSSRSSTMRKWSSASFSDRRSQGSEELEHRVGMMETSLSRFGMILDSVQSDVMQVNKGIKEVSMEMEGVRQKLTGQDSSLQLMNKGQNEIKASLEGGFNSITEQAKKSEHPEKLQEVFSVISTLSEKLQATIQRSQHELHNSFTKEMQAMARSLIIPNQKQQLQPANIQQVTGVSTSAPRGKLPPVKNSVAPPKICVQETMVPKVEMSRPMPETGGWKSVKMEKPASTNRTWQRINQRKAASSIQKNREVRVIIDSDEESDEGFSCLIKENGADLGNCLMEDVKEETDRILRRARRRKRQCRDTIIIN